MLLDQSSLQVSVQFVQLSLRLFEILGVIECERFRATASSNKSLQSIYEIFRLAGPHVIHVNRPGSEAGEHNDPH
jgi:hypothetical protein